MHEGTVSDKLMRKVTHMVVYISSESPVSFKTILQRCVSIECCVCCQGTRQTGSENSS